MLTTKETLDNLVGTEKVAINILDRVRSLNDHLFGMNAPPSDEKEKSPDNARGFINQVNDQNADIVVVLTRVFKELQFMEQTLIGSTVNPVTAPPFKGKTMPKADTSSLESELAESLDANR